MWRGDTGTDRQAGVMLRLSFQTTQTFPSGRHPSPSAPSGVAAEQVHYQQSGLPPQHRTHTLTAV